MAPSSRYTPWLSLLLLTACGTDSPVAPVPESQADVVAPQPPVIYLHYDYMVSSDPENPHSHAPDPQSIAMVVQAFRNHGITLHIDSQHTAIPETPIVTMNGSGPGCVQLSDLRSQYFHPHGGQPWHYAVFGHYSLAFGCALESFPTGNAELPGYDFVVSLAHYFIDQGACPGVLSQDRCRLAEGGTFMHELGHNLDLHHGGDDDIYEKPNYVSVMSYSWQFVGVLSGTAAGDTVGATATHRLDYSDETLPPLDENHLDESRGLGGAPGDRTISVVDAFVPATNEWYFRLIPSAGPIDWNDDGIIENDVKVELNNSYDALQDQFGPPKYEVLHGFDDWAHVQEFVSTPAYLTGTVRTQRITP